MASSDLMLSPAKKLFWGELPTEVFPFPTLSAEEKELAQEMLGAFQRFAEEKIDAAQFDQDSQVPEEIFQELGAMGFCGLAVPEEFGGLELSTTLYCRLFSELAGVDASLATMLGAHQSIGYRALLDQGTPEQKQKWLPVLASGEKLAAFCLTEPGSGSDAYSIKTKAVQNSDGTYTINGQKLWITNGGHADFYSVFCKTEHGGKEKISCFIVEKGQEGLSFGEKEKKMGIRASETRAVFFDNVIVSAADMIGKPGKGFKIAMEVLNTGRLSLGAGSVGGMKASFQAALKHASERKQFGKKLTEFGMIQKKLSDMAALIYASESLVYLITGLKDQGLQDFSLESAACKIYCSEALWSCVDQSMQIAAGIGYMQEYPFERMMRDSRINLIFEGTNEILRLYIALAGAKGPSESLKELGTLTDFSHALKDPIKSLGLLTDYAKKRVETVIPSSSIKWLPNELKKLGEKWTGMLNNFEVQVENSLIKHKKSIVDQEFVLERLAEMHISLLVSLAVFSRTATLLQDSQADRGYYLNLTEVAFQGLRQRFQRNLKRMDSNTDRQDQKVVAGLESECRYFSDIC